MRMLVVTFNSMGQTNKLKQQQQRQKKWERKNELSSDVHECTKQ